MANRAALIRSQDGAGLPVARRGRRFIEFALPSGGKRWVGDLTPLHLLDGSTEIDTTFVPDTGQWQWKMAQGDFDFRARDTFNAGNIMQYTQAGETCNFDPQSINWVNQDNSRQQIAIKQAVAAVADDATLSFPNAYGAGIHFRYEAHPIFLRKFITLDSLAVLPALAPTMTGTIWFEAEFSLSASAGVAFYLDGVKWAKQNNVRVQTANRIEIRDAATGTQLLWALVPPTATDAGGAQVSGTYEVRRQGGPGNLFITVRIPRTWLLTAAYPVQIDPTYSSQPDDTTGIDLHIRENEPDLSVNTDTLSFNSTATTRRFSPVKFDLSSIPAGSTIDDGTFSIWNEVTGVDRDYALNRILSANSAWTEAATWNYAVPSTTRWAGDTGADGGADAGGSVSGTDYSATNMGTWSLGAAEATDTQHDATLNTTEVASMLASNNGFLLRMTTASAGNNGWHSSAWATAGQRPKLVINYTLAGGGEPPGKLQPMGIIF